MSASPSSRRLAAGLALAVTAGVLSTTAPALAAAAPERPASFGERPLTSLKANSTRPLPRGYTRVAPGGTRRTTPAAPSSGTTTTTAPALRSSGTSSAAVSASAVTGTDIRVNYIDGDQAWSAEAKAAFEQAVTVWEGLIESPVPIEIDAAAGFIGPGILGGAGPTDFYLNEGSTVSPQTRNPTAKEAADDVFEPVALINARVGGDVDPDLPDIVAEFDLEFSGLKFAAPGQPADGQIDFFTVVLHEIGHGLGIAGSADFVNGVPVVGKVFPSGDSPSVPVRLALSFDQFTYATSSTQAGTGGRRILDLADGSESLRNALTGDQLYWAGQQALLANGGKRVRLYAPAQFSPGTSYSHLNEATYPLKNPQSLMTPFIVDGEAITTPGQLALSMLADMGWAVPALTGSKFTALTPKRILDTRAKIGTTRTTPVQAGGAVDVKVAGLNGVPSTARAVVLNVTGVQPSAATDVRGYPTPVTPSDVPVVSNLNLVKGVTRANLITVPVGLNGNVRIRNNAGAAHLLADLAGWYGESAAATYTPVNPQRILSTFEAVGTARTTRVPAGGVLELQVSGRGGVPAGATAVAMTVTAVNATGGTDVRVYPADAASVPEVSNLNLIPGPPVPNLVVVKLSSTGKVRLRTSAAAVHLLADVAGFYSTSTSGTLFRPVAPQRILDTRTRIGTGPGAPTRVGPGTANALDLLVAGRASVPFSAARAAVLNVTGVAASRSTAVRVYPEGITTPEVSNLNLGAGQTNADLVISKLGGGQVTLRNAAGDVALLADVAGWFGPA